MHRAVAWVLGGLAAASLLAGCQTVPGGAGPSGLQGSAQEIRTASDQTDNDRRARLRLELAAAYFGRQQNEVALDEVKQALNAKPDMGEAYNLRGLIYAAMGEDRLADDSFQRALQLNPRDGDAKHNYGWFLCQQRLFPQAQQQFDAALSLPQYRDTVRTLLAQGVCQARAGQLDAAERSLVRSYELDAGNPTVALNLAEVLYLRGEYERARFYVRRLNLRQESSNAQSLWLAVRIEHRLGNRGGVEEWGRQLKARFPQAPQTLAFERGRFDE
ncbi:type IV pilus biogenesis/stability protein PilW [Aquincola tertiaricarbonis]|uniref:type IV pilus biogenesis/stability protein PilW n=1 Tax=Aquincola tertiaricarbonis TaxID=391953 RepID=UPI002873270D|nr:type IV pilus biogenesis/stability protein PilW [Aquincola tertiaricarbonis]